MLSLRSVLNKFKSKLKFSSFLSEDYRYLANYRIPVLNNLLHNTYFKYYIIYELVQLFCEHQRWRRKLTLKF